MTLCATTRVLAVAAVLLGCSPQGNETTGSNEAFLPIDPLEILPALLYKLDGAALAICKGNKHQYLQMIYFGDPGSIRVKGRVSGIDFHSGEASDQERPGHRYIETWFEGPIKNSPIPWVNGDILLQMGDGTRMESTSEVPGQSGTHRRFRFLLRDLHLNPATRSVTFTDTNNQSVEVLGCTFQNLTHLVKAARVKNPGTVR